MMPWSQRSPISSGVYDLTSKISMHQTPNTAPCWQKSSNSWEDRDRNPKAKLWDPETLIRSPGAPENTLTIDLPRFFCVLSSAEKRAVRSDRD
jgi:hypothetical protein